jgi:hypothetical protein
MNIIKRRPLPDGDGLLSAEIILAKTDNPYHPFVTWQRNVTDGGCYWGHYFEEAKLAEAVADFETRGR